MLLKAVFTVEAEALEGRPSERHSVPAADPMGKVFHLCSHPSQYNIHRLVAPCWHGDDRGSPIQGGVRVLAKRVRPNERIVPLSFHGTSPSTQIKRVGSGQSEIPIFN